MKILLTSLLGLTSIGSCLTPAVANLINTNTSSLKQEVGTQNSRSINYNKTILLETTNSTKGWKFLFNWDWNNWLPSKVDLSGDGIIVEVDWPGSNPWKSQLKSFEINPGNDDHTIYNEKRDWGATVQEARLYYYFKQTTEDGFNTEFSIYFTTTNYWAITPLSGKAHFVANFTFSD